MGLAYPQMSAYGFLPVFDHLMKAKGFKKNIFSFWMSSDVTKKSQLIFGGKDNKKYTGDIKYFPVADKQFWSIELIGVKVGKQYIGGCSKDAPCYAAIDSGTSFITFPNRHFKDAK